MGRNYENYHTHKFYTNKTIPDSPERYESYIEKATALGQTCITSVEHGWQGNYYLLHKLIKDHNLKLAKRRENGEKNVPKDLKFIFGTEAYWVKDRKSKDNSNCHMIILAKNEKGRKAINLALSIANEDGFFNRRARLDLDLILNLPKDDVFITSGCLAFWNKYDDIEEIVVKLHNHFKNNFMLEVQYHHTDEQKVLNERIINISRKYSIELIAGMDTHYIDFETGDKMRNTILKYKKISYPSEEGWFLDYPSYDEAYNRFKIQGILDEEEILKALDNTNVLKDFDDINLDTNIKLPTMYQNLNQEERNKKLQDIIVEEWNKFIVSEGIKEDEISKYNEGILYEYNEVEKTGMADYFLLHYEALKRGKEKGGRVTKRGRGSAVGYFINTLLGFSKVDRFKAPIKLYPERFMTADRILKSRSLPDIDNNIDRQEPFVEAFRELLGEHGIYPMIAFGTLGKASAIKLYMGAEGIDASIQNEVTKQLKEYENALKHCEDDEEKEKIDINKYISKKYSHFVELSKPYHGIVIQCSSHACGHLLLNGDIREEIGIIRCESETSKKSILVTCIDGAMADYYKFLKSDLLIVDVVGLTEDIWERIGKPSITNNQLEKILASEEGKKAWDIYEKGYTLCVNQVEKDKTKAKCMKYKPKNTAELSAFVAAIRPSFASLLDNFLNREHYSTGVRQLDDVLKDSFNYMLYQESIMAYLNWLGIDNKETYDLLKKISKKKFTEEEQKELKTKLLKQWKINVGTEKDFEESWKVVEDAASYAFNSSHSYCVGNDGAELAYLKAEYPYEFYEVALNRYDRKKNKDKLALLKSEMKEAFNIKEGELKFGLDNRKFTLDKENKCIHPSLSSIKNIGMNVAEQIYELSLNNNYKTMLELLLDIRLKTSINASQLEIMTKLDYFRDFGKRQKILTFIKYFNIFYDKTNKRFKKVAKKKTLFEKNIPTEVIDIIKENSKETASQYGQLDTEKILNKIYQIIPDDDISLGELIYFQNEIVNNITYKNNSISENYLFIMGVDDKYTPVITTYCVNNGEIKKHKISKKIYKFLKVQVGDVIYADSFTEKFGKKIDGKDENGKNIWVENKNKIDIWIDSYSLAWRKVDDK